MARNLIESALRTLGDSNSKEFVTSLDTQSFPESFGILADHELRTSISIALGEPDLNKWITNSDVWDTERYGPGHILSPATCLLHLLWQDLQNKLLRKLKEVSKRTPIASKGAILCFFGRAFLSIIVEYTRSTSGAFRLRPIASLIDPNGVLELTNLLHDASPEARNAIKNTAFSVDKLVYQRGCIVHVDRQREDVFGPTIDTVILGELLVEWLVSEDVRESITALEIGPGSGLLSTVLGSSDRVGELTSIDLNSAAVGCTLKNLQINEIALDAMHQVVRVRAERFDVVQMATKSDIIVCNPPYIPAEPQWHSDSSREYDRAVGGLALCTQVLNSLDMLLSPDGVLLLMVSSLSHDEVLQSIPEAFHATPALGKTGRRVPLDVDAVWQSSQWRDRLLEEHRIERGDDGGLWHELRPLWIQRRKEN